MGIIFAVLTFTGENLKLHHGESEDNLSTREMEMTEKKMY